MLPSSETRARVLVAVIEDSHLASAEQFAATVDDALVPLGLTAQVLMVDLAQRELRPLPTGAAPSTTAAVENTLAGRAYQLGEIVSEPVRDSGAAAAEYSATRLLWVPLLDGSERVGVLRVGLRDDDDVIDDGDDELCRWLWALAGVIGHVLMSKLTHSITLQRLRAGTLSIASELMWQLMPARTFATDRVVISALLEPTDQVAGDAYDYALDTLVHVAVFDGVGHDLAAGISTTLAVTAIRNARRHGISDLGQLAACADAVLAVREGPLQFVTAVLATLDTDTGELAYLLAGHPAPLLIRDGHVVKELTHPPRPPLGITGPDIPTCTDVVGREQLEPGDRVLFYSDGVTEARDQHGEFFGEHRLIVLAERAELDGLSAPETLRRLVGAVLAHQHDRLQDDATALLLEWGRAGHLQLLPTLNGATRTTGVPGRCPG